MPGRIDRLLRAFERRAVLGAPYVRPPVDLATVEPERESSSTRAVVAGWLAAMVLPVGVGVALIPVRGAAGSSLSLVMVLPVLAVATLTGPRTGALAGLTAAAAFGVLHTEPHYRFTIDHTDDIVETAVLLIVGVTTGLVADMAQRATARSRTRQRELTAVVEFLDDVGRVAPDEAVEHARASITTLLQARACQWLPGYQGTAAPVMTSTGALRQGGEQTLPDGATARLPRHLELPVGTAPAEHGRFVVTSSSAHISVEERRAAATVAAALGRLLD